MVLKTQGDHGWVRTLCPRKPLVQRKGGADCEMAGVMSDCEAHDSVHPKPASRTSFLPLSEGESACFPSPSIGQSC